MNELRHTYECSILKLARVVQGEGVSHATRMNEYVTRMNELRHTYECNILKLARVVRGEGACLCCLFL